MTPEEGHRWRKVARMIALAYLGGFTPDQVKAFDENQRALLAQMAGGGPPSSLTWRLLVESIDRAQVADRSSR